MHSFMQDNLLRQNIRKTAKYFCKFSDKFDGNLVSEKFDFSDILIFIINYNSDEISSGEFCKDFL